MKGFIEKLINRLKERENHYRDEAKKVNKFPKIRICRELQMRSYSTAIKVVNKLAEEYNNGWIPCSERLPQEDEPVGTLCQIVNVMLKNGTITSGWCNRYLEKWYVLDHHHDYPLPYEYKDVIAWQPLPEPYKEGELV